MDYSVIGANIKRRRKDFGLTQGVLAKEIGLSTVFISQIENGVRKPSLETLVKIAGVLNVSVDLLLTPTENNESQALIKEVVSILQKRRLEQIELFFDVVKQINNYLVAQDINS